MIGQDFLRRFLFEELDVRGEWVKLGASWQAAKQHQRGPQIVQQQLGQALAAVVMLSATIKFKGSMILQAQGNGDFKTLVAQSTHDRKIRGLIRSSVNVPAGSLAKMFWQGRLVLTIESEKVRLFGSEPVEFKCACSRLKIERTLRVLGRAEVEDILQEQDIIQVDCEFCNERYCFDKIDVENILSQEIVVNESATRH